MSPVDRAAAWRLHRIGSKLNIGSIGERISALSRLCGNAIPEITSIRFQDIGRQWTRSI
ncbi:hypothetical protein QZN00_23125 [Burkholderia multivorans]|nr:hypothetical protein [Burkholderia multivorans]